MRFNSSFIALLAVGLVACGSAEDVSEETGAFEPTDFSTVVPSTESLEVEIEEEDVEPESTHPSSFYEQAQEVAARVNQARQTLQSHIDELKASVEPERLEIAGLDCAVWEADRARFYAKLSSCRTDIRGLRYQFVLEGRPLDSESDDDFVVLAAGRGRFLNPSRIESSVAGQIGYDFDAARLLFGNDGPTGRIAVGYRELGSVRQLRIAVDEVQWNAETEVRSAFHNYNRVIGRGGKLAYSRYSDFLTTDEDGTFVYGQDGLREAGRVSLAWARARAARATATVCGGTLGEECRRVV
ncbi:MAG: hypothetical protein AAF658_07330, partial [Myxococcota bacterium]